MLATAPLGAQGAQEPQESWPRRFERAVDDGERLALLAELDPGNVPDLVHELSAVLGSSRIGRPVRIQVAVRLATDGGPAAFDPLAREIHAGTAAEVRREALRVLPATGDPRAWPLVLTALDDPNLRVVAAAVLADIGDVRAVPPLRARLERFAARPGLVGPFGEALARLDPDQASEVLLPLYESGATADTVDEVVRALGACRLAGGLRARLRADFDAGSSELRARALAALVACGGLSSVSFLLGRLEARAEDRVAVVRALGDLGHEFAVDPLRRQAGTGSDAVRVAAVRALGRIDHPTARDALVDIAAQGSDPLAIATALLTLGHRDEASARTSIVGRLDDERSVLWPDEEGAPEASPARVCDAAYLAGLLLCGDEVSAPSGTVDRRARNDLRARLTDDRRPADSGDRNRQPSARSAGRGRPSVR